MAHTRDATSFAALIARIYEAIRWFVVVQVYPWCFTSRTFFTVQWTPRNSPQMTKQERIRRKISAVDLLPFFYFSHLQLILYASNNLPNLAPLAVNCIEIRENLLGHTVVILNILPPVSQPHHQHKYNWPYGRLLFQAWKCFGMPDAMRQIEECSMPKQTARDAELFIYKNVFGTNYSLWGSISWYLSYYTYAAFFSLSWANNL